MPRGDSLPDLVDVMRRLLAPDGCPWDREQTLASLKPFLLEETYEVLEALDGGTPQDHREELGDLLMQIVFQSALRETEGAFHIDDVVAGIAEKLRRRHPHVFGDQKLETSAQVLEQWTALKEKEKPRRVLDGVPLAMPALARAQRLTERAGAVGFDWPDVAGARAKVTEELQEVDEAARSGDADRLRAELGDLLFATVNVARKLGVDAEGALREASDRFTSRFRFVEDRLRDGGRSPKEASLAEMDALWDEAKLRERDREPGAR
jgi:MazG family protein